jgi:hypothetical protein
MYKNILFLNMETSPGWLSKLYFLFNIKNAPLNIAANFFYSRLFRKKRHYQRAFDDNMKLIHVFNKHNFRAAEKGIPSPAPPTVLAGGWGSSGSFQPEAVRIRVIGTFSLYR